MKSIVITEIIQALFGYTQRRKYLILSGVEKADKIDDQIQYLR